MTNLKKTIVCILVIAVISGFWCSAVYAHGPAYDMKTLDNGKVRITLEYKGEENKGIAIKFYNLSNGKTLYIGYSLKKSSAGKAYLDFDLTGAIPPLRVVLINADDPEWIPFSDIKDIEQEEYIRHLHDAGIVNGKPGGIFDPGSTITRAEFASMIVRALNLKNTGSETQKFLDIENSWAKDNIIIAAQHGIVSGYGDGNFGPNDPIKVAEVCSILYKSFSFKTAGNGKYLKIKTGKWYTEYVKRMFDAGILTTSDSIYKDFDEMKPISRADCAMMLSRALSTY
mgnify:CR=1 FL=1